MSAQFEIPRFPIDLVAGHSVTSYHSVPFRRTTTITCRNVLTFITGKCWSQVVLEEM